MHSGKIRSSTLLFGLLVIFSFLIITYWSLQRFFKNFGDSLAGGGDVLLIDWILNQNIQKIPFHLDIFFQGNIFYPYKNVMAFSDLFLPASLLSYLPIKISALPAVAYNFNLIFGQIALLFVSFLWFYDIAKDKLTSLTGAVALSLSQIRFNFIGYLQMWISTWWLISCWMLWRYFRYGERKYIYLASFFAIVQVWESPLPFFFIVFTGLVMAFVYRGKNAFNDVKAFIFPGVFFFVFTYPIIIKYFQVSKEYGITRSIREAAHFSMSLNEIWGTLFAPGLFALFIIGLCVLFARKLKEKKDVLWISLLGIFSFLMALGPVLKIGGSTFKIFGRYFIPLPYGILYYIVPGFKGLRSPLRWIWLFAFCISAFFVVVLSKYKSRYKGAILVGCLMLAIIGGTRANFSIEIQNQAEYPEVYRVLKGLPQEIVIEMPMYSWGVGRPFQHEFEREFFSIYHRKKLVNGASGLNPPGWEELQSFLWNNFPDSESALKLRNLGVNYVIIHKDEFSVDKLEKIYSWGKGKAVWQDSQSVIYQLD
jgi:uncharacterized membrane protein